MSTFDLGNNISILNKLPWFADARFATIADAENNPVWDESKIVYIEDQDPHWYTYSSSGNCIPINNSTANMVNSDALARIGTSASASQSEINGAIEEKLIKVNLNNSVTLGAVAVETGVDTFLLDTIDVLQVKRSHDNADISTHLILKTLDNTVPVEREYIAIFINDSDTYNLTIQVSSSQFYNGTENVLLSTLTDLVYDDDNIVLEPREVLMLRFNFYNTNTIVTSSILRNQEKYVEQTPTNIAQSTIDILLDEANWTSFSNEFDYTDQSAEELGLLPGMEFWSISGVYSYSIRKTGIYRIKKSKTKILETATVEGTNASDSETFDVQIADTTTKYVFTITGKTYIYSYNYSVINLLLPAANKFTYEDIDIIFKSDNTSGATTLNLCKSDATVLQTLSSGDCIKVITDGENYYVK